MGTTQTRLQVINNTTSDIVDASVSGTDSFDFQGNGPDFHGAFVASKSSLDRRAEVNNDASNCPFVMTLKFRNGLVDVFRIYQKHALGCCAGFQHWTRSHDIFYERRDGNRLVIRVENTSQQIQNEKAEERNKEGDAALNRKEYDVAIQKFDEVLRLSNETTMVNSARKKREIAVAKGQIKKRVEELNKQGEEAMSKKEYDSAVKKFDEALEVMPGSWLVKSNKSDACGLFGRALLQEAWELEGDTSEDKSKEAHEKLCQAKGLLQEAEEIRSMAEQAKSLKLINLKIDGNRLFNKANEEEKEAFKVFESAKSFDNFEDYSVARSKYKEALTKYEDAKKKFEQGATVIDNTRTRFEDCAKIVEEHIEDVTKVIEDIYKAELQSNLRKVTVDEEKNEAGKDGEVNINSDLQEQVDVVTDAN